MEIVPLHSLEPSLSTKALNRKAIQIPSGAVVEVCKSKTPEEEVVYLMRFYNPVDEDKVSLLSFGLTVDAFEALNTLIQQHLEQ